MTHLPDRPQAGVPGGLHPDGLTSALRNRPRVVAAWRMTVNGQALPAPPSPDTPVPPPGTTLPELVSWLEEQHARGVDEAWLTQDPELIGQALDDGLVDHVVCEVDPSFSTRPVAATTGGRGVSTMHEAWTLEDVRWSSTSDATRIEGRVRNPVALPHDTTG